MAKFTDEPFATDVPAAGVWLIARPEGTVSLGIVVSVPTLRFAAWIAACAAVCVSPITVGTRTGAGPDDVTRLTADPLTIDVPGTGVWLVTWPGGAASLA